MRPTAAAGRSSLWLVLACGAGVFLAADDQTSPVAALPAMIDDLGLAQDQFYRAAWLVNGYILGYVVAMPLIGRVADAYGHARVYIISMAVFLVGSVAVAVSQDLTAATLARAFQAVGGGAVVPVAMAIVTDTLPAERRALGLGAIAAASEAGGLLGPLWGGGMTELLGWRSVFWINVPLCLPVIAGLWRTALPLDRRHPRTVDVRGGVALAVSLSLFTLALTDDPIDGRPPGLTAALYGLALAGLLYFLWSQAGAREPLVRRALFRARPVPAGFLLNALMGGALIVAMVAVPIFTNAVLQGSALDGGVNLVRLTAGLPVGALAGGFLTGRAGAARVALAGVLLVAAGFLGMSRWDADPGFFALTAPLFVAGVGLGLVIAPVSSSALFHAEEGERATLSALLTVARLLGALIGVALLTTRGLSAFYAEAGLIPLDDPRYSELLTVLQRGTFEDIFLITALLSLVALVPAAMLGAATTDGEGKELPKGA